MECDSCIVRPAVIFYRDESRCLCEECAKWSDYWNSLTSEQKREEIQMMDAYVEECQSGLHN